MLKVRAVRSVLKNLERLCGTNFRMTVKNIRGAPRFVVDARRYRSLQRTAKHAIKYGQPFPILHEFDDSSGEQGHYFWQDLWAARRIYAERPVRHIDVGSRLDGFIAHLLSFRDVESVDVRPLRHPVPGLSFIQDDATHMHGFESNSIDSLSCLHAVEHFGLGRYGDPIDPDACFKALKAFERVLCPNGRLYLSVPVGQERLEFNAHRVFQPSTIMAAVPSLKLLNFCAVDDMGTWHDTAQPSAFKDAHYACGMFEFTKVDPPLAYD